MLNYLDMLDNQKILEENYIINGQFVRYPIKFYKNH